MKTKIYLILAFLVISITILEAKTNEENEVEIDLNSKTLSSKDGVNVRYGYLKLKAFEIKMDDKNNKAYVPGDFFIEVDNPTGKLKIDSKDGEFTTNGESGSFKNTFGYLEVGAVTGADKYNDRIYFGGEEAKYLLGKTYLKNAWFTTDPKIIQTRDANEVGYHIQSDLITIEPDKQVTFKNSNLFIGKTDVIPFSLPWYRLNIRQGSEVPLFPSWGTEEDYGWTVTSGVLWGDKKSGYRGGLAPKFADTMGFLIGRMENWYKFDKYGESRLNIDDWLIHKKSDDDDPEKHFDRWNINYSHKYTGEYGFLNLDYQNATYNMIPSMDDAIDDYFGGKNPNTKSGWKYVNDVPNKGGSIGFYNLNTELSKLGEDKDISIKSNVHLVSDKKAYGVLVADRVDDMDYGAMVDDDLKSDVSINKENDRYSIGAYYNYLYDMDKGSTKNDLQARAENFGFHFNDKDYGIELSYDEKNGDKYRVLNSWERDPNFSKLNNKGVYDLDLDYTPWTVEEYSIYDSKNFKALLGEYRLYKDIYYKIGYDYNEFEHKLNLQNDPFREKALNNTKNYRDKEYNRFENIIYNKTTEQRGHLDFIYDDLITLTLAGGTTKEEIWDREGIYNKEAWSKGSYKVYINDSDFYEMGLSTSKLSLNRFGDVTLYGNIRADRYKKGYDNKIDRKISTNDSSIRYRVGMTHNIELFDNSDNKNRTIDTSLNNRFSYMYQDYSYDSDSNMTKDIRMFHKENSWKVANSLDFDLGNTKTIYSVDYKEVKRATNDSKKQEVVNQKIDFLIDGNNSFGITYGMDKRFTENNEKDENHNDLSFENYGLNYTFKNNYFYYKNRKIKSSIWEIKGVDNANEKIEENVYGYTYTLGKDRLNLEYIEGKDSRIESYKEVINNKNKTYSVSYFVGGDVEQTYRASYEDYKNKGAWNDSLKNYDSDIIYLAYTYKDKRFTDNELVSYARSEYNKSADELTQDEIDRIRQILEDRDENSSRFNLGRITDDREDFGNYKRGLHISLMMQKNEARYDETGDYFKSLEELEGRLFYSYNRIGLGYIYNQKSNYRNISTKKGWSDTEKEHEFSLNAKVGKPSEGWRTKAYVKFYDQLKGQDKNGRSSFDGLGVEVGKEMGYYEWAVAYERDYSYRTKDYEWSVAIQFKLLTFPNMNIFGIGSRTDIDGKTSPKTYLFNGLKIDDLDD